MYNILIADDEVKIRELVKKYALYEGHTISEASDGMQAVSMAKSGEYDLVILDVMMPELDGFSATREIRKFSEVPVILLSARSEEYDRIHGFELGADDYVVKPFSPKELMLRIDAIIARYKKNGTNAREVFTYNSLKADISARIVYIDSERIALSPKEYELLFYMIHNHDIALSRERLLKDVWGYDFFGDDRTLDTHIKLLRKNLGVYSDMIVTLRGVGYRFETEK